MNNVYRYDIYFTETTFVGQLVVADEIARDPVEELRCLLHEAARFKYDSGWTVQRVDRKPPGASWFRDMRWPLPIEPRVAAPYSEMIPDSTDHYRTWPS